MKTFLTVGLCFISLISIGQNNAATMGPVQRPEPPADEGFYGTVTGIVTYTNQLGILVRGSIDVVSDSGNVNTYELYNGTPIRRNGSSVTLYSVQLGDHVGGYLFVKGPRLKTATFTGRLNTPVPPPDLKTVDGKLYNARLSTNWITIPKRYAALRVTGRQEDGVMLQEYSAQQGGLPGDEYLVKHLPGEKTMTAGTIIRDKPRVMMVGITNIDGKMVSIYDFGVPKKH
jgi:hypothetical protein